MVYRKFAILFITQKTRMAYKLVKRSMMHAAIKNTVMDASVQIILCFSI